MKIIRYPKKETWEHLLARPVFDTKYLRQTVAEILDEVKLGGDAALRRFARKFDRVKLEDFLVSEQEFAEAENGNHSSQNKYRKISRGASRKARSY